VCGSRTVDGGGCAILLALLLDSLNTGTHRTVAVASEEIGVVVAETAVVGLIAGVELCLDGGFADIEGPVVLLA